MFQRQFPICQVEGPIEPAVPFSHMGFGGAIPNKCRNCKLMFEGSCTRGGYIGIPYLQLDYGPCGIDGPTFSVEFDNTEQNRRVGIPWKCSTCHFLRDLNCTKDDEKWGRRYRGLDWGDELVSLTRWVTTKEKDTTKEEKLYMIIFNMSHGFVDRNGKIIVKPKFRRANHFFEGLAAVKIEDKWGFIDKSGKIVIEPKFDRATSFREGLALVKIEDKWSSIDNTGKVVIEPKFDHAIQFSEGLSRVRIEDKYGFIDKTGNMVIDPKFDHAMQFSEGLADVKIEDQYFFIDKTGKKVFESKFNFILGFFERLAAVVIEGKYGFINKNGKVVIEPKFDRATSFNEGRAAVRIEGKYGFIDKTGEVIDGPYRFDKRIYSRFGDVRYIYIDKTRLYALESPALWSERFHYHYFCLYP